MKHPAFVCCAVSFLFLGATSVQAQETSDLTDVHFYPPSAVSMMKYIDYPVSHRTGIPEISIPLYTVRSGSLELPVNLSFHLDDFTRVNQLAGAAGAGWSLSCDLQVSRIINGGCFETRHYEYDACAFHDGSDAAALAKRCR